ncbi:hypothetical protein RHMOL_Rhmol11G0043300 [Rhododendron molle]|uniref:Uncharacterized protein n=1 Tax=Rhododendron molle TaxID=49168 RepID=A0ACC0LPF1_RHOML|nr:hypothetical protein RHMOL_Rhmol11G0043300 [Rhododendron molle]
MVDPWLSCAHPGIRDPVRPSFIPASHPIYGGSVAFLCTSGHSGPRASLIHSGIAPYGGSVAFIVLFLCTHSF